jgi:hypothetical protein
MSENTGVEVSNRHHSEEEDEDVGIKISDRHQSEEEENEDIGVKIADRHHSGEESEDDTEEQDDEFSTSGTLIVIVIFLTVGSIAWLTLAQLGIKASNGVPISLTLIIASGLTNSIIKNLDYFGGDSE